MVKLVSDDRKLLFCWTDICDTLSSNKPGVAHLWVFEVKIEAPAGVIFDGTVSFSNTYQVIVALKTESTMTIDAQVIRAGSKPAV